MSEKNHSAAEAPAASFRQGRPLPPQWFARPALQVARDLLGKVLVRTRGKARLEGIITEVEAYTGPHDKACHAYKGRTRRTEVMFGPAGHWYVYLCYGMHEMLNVVTGREGYPAAVLIRGVACAGEWVEGPGRVTRRLCVGRAFNALPAVPSRGLWVEDRGIRIPVRAVARTPRIGIAYAQEWREKPYRFVVQRSFWERPNAPCRAK